MQGFYDQNLDFVQLEHIQFVFSMNNSNTLGTHSLSTRFTARVGIIAIQEPNKQDLSDIYTSYYSIVSSITSMDKGNKKLLLSKICPSMIAIYEQIKTTFRRDEYRHFILTLRDLTQWTFGLIRYGMNDGDIVNIWYNEGMRILHDRMPNEKTKQMLGNIFRSIMNKHQLPFKEKKEVSLYCTFVTQPHDDDIKDSDDMDDSIKCMKQMGDSFSCVSINDFKTVISTKIRSYEKEYNELHLILFQEFLENLQKLDRIISHGWFHNMVLIGNSGIGRKLMTKLLCYIHRIECQILRVSQEYHGNNQFANTLKEILKSTGIDNQKILLFIEDCQLIDDTMLEYLNQLVTSGDIIGLFEDKELDALLLPIKEEYRQNTNAFDEHKSIYEYFISRVRQNLYITLSMDPSNKNFINICGSNPSLITNCNVIWMGNQWNNQSMIQYSKSQLKSIFNHCVNEQQSNDILRKIQLLHHENIEYGACPQSLMQLISIYNSIFQQKLSNNQQLKSHLTSGLDKV